MAWAFADCGITVMLKPVRRFPDGSRECYIFGCGNRIHVCNGAVVAGDMLLWQNGQIPANCIRERCGDCTLLYILRREGHYGPFVKAFCWLRDLIRKVHWLWQKHTYPKQYDTPVPLFPPPRPTQAH